MRHAATLSSLEMMGLVLPMSSLWLISWPEIATSSSWMALRRSVLAKIANDEAARTSTVSAAITARTIRRVRRCCVTRSAVPAAGSDLVTSMFSQPPRQPISTLSDMRATNVTHRLVQSAVQISMLAIG